MATAAGAEEDVDELRGMLGESVVTTASQASEAASTAPATSTVLTGEDIRRYGILSLDEAIDFLSLGVVTGNPFTHSDIGARGVMLTGDRGAHFLLLVNGHVENDPVFGAATVGQSGGFPMELIDRIEVIVGPGSVLYGSNAMLGVINVVTKNARNYEGLHLIGESEVGRSYRLAIGAGQELDLFDDPTDVTVQLDYFSQVGPAFDLGPQDMGIDPVVGEPYRFRRDVAQPTGVWGGRLDEGYYTRAPSGLLRIRQGNLEITTRGRLTEQAHPLTNAVVWNDPENFERTGRLWSDVKYRIPVSAEVTVTPRLYGDLFFSQTYRPNSQGNACLNPGVTNCLFYYASRSQWVGTELQTTVDWTADGALVTLLGVDGRFAWVGGKREAYDFDTSRLLEPTRDVWREEDPTLGAYVQQTWKPLDWLALNAGARLDARSGFDPVISPRAAAATNVWEGGTFKVVYSEAFRSPSWSEMGSAYGYRARSPELKPEEVSSLEASIEQRLGAQRLLFGMFYTQWSDLIEDHVLTAAEIQDELDAGNLDAWRPGGLVTQQRNVSDVQNYGYNGGIQGTVLDGQLLYGANVTAAIAHREDPATGDTRPLTVAPRVFGNARVAYAFSGPWPTLALATRYLGRRPTNRAYVAGFRPEPFADPQLELRGTVSGPAPALPGLSYRLTAKYAVTSHSAYVIGPAQVPTANIPTPELAPVDRFRFTLGLQYDLR